MDFGTLAGTSHIESTRSSGAELLIRPGSHQLADLNRPTAATGTEPGLDISDWKPFSQPCAPTSGAG